MAGEESREGNNNAEGPDAAAAGSKGQQTEEDGGSEELRERLLRLAAEFDNYKKRTLKQMEGAKDMGKAEIMAKLLPTLDEFELALSSKSSDGDHYKGMELVFSNLMNALKSCGLSQISSTGKFDPYRHEILLAKESEKPEGTILEVVRKGYMLNNMMLRPASVIVSKSMADEERKEKKNDADKTSENKGEQK